MKCLEREFRALFLYKLSSDVRIMIQFFSLKWKLNLMDVGQTQGKQSPWSTCKGTQMGMTVIFNSAFYSVNTSAHMIPVFYIHK
jgi:hypothetical protein